jgi:hypothetical protein
MFGMLDYRANKLYMLIFGIPLFLMQWLFIVGVPLAAVAIAKTYSESWIGIFLVSFIALFLLMIVQSILGYVIGKFVEFVFALMVDVIPADGRTKEEAKIVTWGGDRAVKLLDLSKIEPKSWTDEMIENTYTGFFIFFYKDRIRERLCFLRDYQQNNPDYVANNWNNERLLQSNGLSIPMSEQVICNPLFRGWIISALLFLYLAIFQPTF